MWQKVGRILMGVLLAVGLSACATDYGIKAGGPHFASWEHYKYSTQGEPKPPLTKLQLEYAKQEKWWGVPVDYTSDEVRE